MHLLSANRHQSFTAPLLLLFLAAGCGGARQTQTTAPRREQTCHAGAFHRFGSSLEVYPVAGLPQETVSAGGALAIVNRGPTPFDRLAEVRIDGGAGETLGALSRLLRA